MGFVTIRPAVAASFPHIWISSLRANRAGTRTDSDAGSGYTAWRWHDQRLLRPARLTRSAPPLFRPLLVQCVVRYRARFARSLAWGLRSPSRRFLNSTNLRSSLRFASRSAARWRQEESPDRWRRAVSLMETPPSDVSAARIWTSLK